MSWFDACHNPQVIEQLYSTPPSLDLLEVRRLSMDGDSARFSISALLPVFPDQPSQRWHPDSNAALVHLDLWCPQEVRIEGWSGSTTGTFELERAGPDRLRFCFRSDSTVIEGQCVAVRIAGVDAYVSTQQCA